MPIGPSEIELSPMKQNGRLRFPVLHNLTDKLADPNTAHPDLDIRYALATCAAYGYSDANTVAMMMARMGLFENHCAEFTLRDDAMLIDSTAFLVQSKDGRVAILCYRGTQPLNFIDWLLDADLDSETISLLLSPHGDPDRPDPAQRVHSGFYRNMRATRFKIVRALERALNKQSVLEDHDEDVDNPLQALYITGHSMGGAMAALMAVTLNAEDAYEHIRSNLRAVYTFGQPMVGYPGVAEYWERHRKEYWERHGKATFQLIRYVHRSDVVPHLPARESGVFAHFGAEYQYQDSAPGQDRWVDSSHAPNHQASLLELAMAPGDFFAHRVTLLRGAAARWNDLAREINGFNPLPVRLGKSAVRALPGGDALTRLPLAYSFDDHSPNHYISNMAPNGTLRTRARIR